MIHDKSTDFNFEYSFAAGYVLSTTLKKFINTKDDDADEKLDYLTTTFENYLIEKGFKKNDSILNNIYGILNRSKEYISGNHIVTISKESNFMTSIFKVTMKNKEIEDNIDEINKIIQEESIKYEYQSLSKILK